MTSIFKNVYIFSILFFIVLFTDIIIKINMGVSIFRFISKPLVIVLLVVFYLVNHREASKLKISFVLFALVFFLAGDALLILHETKVYDMLGIICFIFGKTFYVLRFANNKDFDANKLLPFFVLCVVYVFAILTLISNNLYSYYSIVLVYMFVAFITIIFSILRRNYVNKESFYLVLTGVLFSVLSDTVTALKSFYNKDFPYQAIIIMLFYGISQYLIILGLVKIKYHIIDYKQKLPRSNTKNTIL